MGWWVEIAVIIECYLFIKHTVGTLLTAFRIQLKQSQLLALASLSGAVFVCECDYVHANVCLYAAPSLWH